MMLSLSWLIIRCWAEDIRFVDAVHEPGEKLFAGLICNKMQRSSQGSMGHNVKDILIIPPPLRSSQHRPGLH